MKKLIKTIILIPVWPLIWMSGAKSADEPLYEWTKGTCYGNGLALLKWHQK